MATIKQALMPEHEAIIRDLFAQYLRWVCQSIQEESGVVFEAESMIVHDMQTIDTFLPPAGTLLLSYEDGHPAGCACTRTIGEEIAELKRMYVRPQCRDRGIGSKLVHESIRLVKERGYSAMRHDSVRFMSDAQRIYRSCGFKDILTKAVRYQGSTGSTRCSWNWNLRQVSGKTSY